MYKVNGKNVGMSFRETDPNWVKTRQGLKDGLGYVVGIDVFNPDYMPSDELAHIDTNFPFVNVIPVTIFGSKNEKLSNDDAQDLMDFASLGLLWFEDMMPDGSSFDVNDDGSDVLVKGKLFVTCENTGLTWINPGQR